MKTKKNLGLWRCLSEMSGTPWMNADNFVDKQMHAASFVSIASPT